jgi:hypothetical protein
MLVFICSFGLYPIAKNYIERIKVVWIEIVLKLMFFNVALWPGLELTKTILPPELFAGDIFYITIAVLEVGFLVFDWLCTKWIHYYFEKIAPKIRKKH